jgi:predicted DCC family thiol-disulfide oxidoreductase YuxK
MVPKPLLPTEIEMPPSAADPSASSAAAHAPAPGEPGGPVVILYDGVCALCNGTVTFALKHDRAGRFRFAALQSDFGQGLLRALGMPHDALDTLVVVQDGRPYVRSRGIIRILRDLGMPWSLLGAAAMMPRPVADAVYDMVARNRYRWFGRHESCPIPPPEVRSRFLG